MKAGTRGLALTEVCASPSQLYDAVSDVRRMGEWSPECQRCEWIDEAVGPAVGARFKGRNRRGIIRWSQRRESLWLTPVRSSPLSLATAVGT